MDNIKGLREMQCFYVYKGNYADYKRNWDKAFQEHVQTEDFFLPWLQLEYTQALHGGDIQGCGVKADLHPIKDTKHCQWAFCINGPRYVI